MLWKIFYEDFTTFSDVDGTPWEAPTQRVQFIIQKTTDNKYNILSGTDCYMYDPDRCGWWAGKHFDADMHKEDAKRPCVLYGRMVGDAVWNKMCRKVFDELPTKKKYWYHFQEAHAGYDAYVVEGD